MQTFSTDVPFGNNGLSTTNIFNILNGPRVLWLQSCGDRMPSLLLQHRALHADVPLKSGLRQVGLSVVMCTPELEGSGFGLEILLSRPSEELLPAQTY